MSALPVLASILKILKQVYVLHIVLVAKCHVEYVEQCYQAGPFGNHSANLASGY
jgi:hypothetical protein